MTFTTQIKEEITKEENNNIEDLKRDCELLKEYNMDKCNYVTEISEDDYSTRKDQIKDIEMLYELFEY